jgi:hypothetical protein
MSTRNISWGRGVKAAGACGSQSYNLHMPTAWKCGASTSWNPQGLSRAFPFYTTCRMTLCRYSWIRIYYTHLYIYIYMCVCQPFFLVVKGHAADATEAPQPCGLLCNPAMQMKMMIIFCPFLSNGAPVEWNWQGKTKVLGQKPVPVPLCPPQIPHGLSRDQTRASAVGGRRLTASAMARPCPPLVFTQLEKEKYEKSQQFYVYP